MSTVIQAQASLYKRSQETNITWTSVSILTSFNTGKRNAPFGPAFLTFPGCSEK